MPEDPADARLTGLLAPAPHVVPEKKAKKKATGTRKSSRFQVSSDDDSEADSSHKGEEDKKKKASPPAGGGKKRKASPTREAEGSKKGKTLSLDCSANASDDDEDWPPRAKPLVRS